MTDEISVGDSSLDVCDANIHQCQCPTNDASPAVSALKIMTWDVHCLRLEQHTKGFEELTGISVKIACIEDFNDMQAEILSDAKTQTGLWDGWKFPPAIIGELDLLGGLYDLTPFVKDDSNSILKWNDIFRFNRENGAVWDSKVAVIPLDGDVHSFYYRTDLFDKYGKVPPTTWEEYTELAKFFNGKEELVPNTNETVKIAGSCVTRKDRPFYWTILVLSSMTQNAGTKSGALFDPENMEPLLGEAFVRTLQYMEEQFVYGAENEFDGDFASVNIAMMNEGKCAMTYNWGDSFTESQKAPPTSLIGGLLGTAQTPGSTQYLNRNTMRLEPCTEETCSCASFAGIPEDGSCINSAPYAAFTGWSGGCTSFTSHAQQEACAKFFAYVASPDLSLIDTIPNVTVGAPFISADPFRKSQTVVDEWVNAGLPRDSTAEYLSTVNDQLSDPNVVLDMRIPETFAFQDSMNQAFRDHITTIKANMDAGKVGDDVFSNDEARWVIANRLRDEWKTIITNYDLENPQPHLLEIYQRNLGVFSSTVDYNYLTYIRWVGLAFFALITLGSIAGVVWTYMKSEHRVVKASQPGFLVMICVGTLIMGLSILPMSIDDSVASVRGCSVACMATPWFVSIGFTTAFSALFSKIWRLNQLFENAVNFRRVVVRAKDVLMPFIVLLTLNVTLLLTWTFVDPLYWIRTAPDDSMQSYGRCVAKGNAWKYLLSLIVVVNFLALALANIQAYKARNISTEFAESTYVMMTLGCFLQALLIGLPLLVLVQSDSTANYFVRSALVFVVCSAMLLLMFVPKYLLTRDKPGPRNTATMSRFTRPSGGVFSTAEFNLNKGPEPAKSGSGDESNPKNSNGKGSDVLESREFVVQEQAVASGEPVTPSGKEVEATFKCKLGILRDLMVEQGIDTSTLFEQANLQDDTPVRVTTINDVIYND